VIKPRQKQLEILAYTTGRMGVSAVPGSGKTHILSYLAADLVTRGLLSDNQEVLVVTLVNSAVDNFASRVAGIIRQRGLIPKVGYRVRTLHGLAHDIVRERPELAGLSEGFQIVDERVVGQIMQAAVHSWLRQNSEKIEDYLVSDLTERTLERVRKDEWPKLVMSIAANLIRQAKDLQISPIELRQLLDAHSSHLPLVEMTHAIYSDYQRFLSDRGAVDFDDLIGKALSALQADPAYLKRLRERWPYILEDEAQDSSRLQEEILRLLVGEAGNWVRVGDPNQAIFETFTTATPQFLRDFLKERGVEARQMPNSGRSTGSIMALANHLIRWTQVEHPIEALRGALTPPYIEATPEGDPQPNPVDNPEGIDLDGLPYTPLEELRVVAKSIKAWLPQNEHQTVAVLVPTNQRGFDVVKELSALGIPHMEILQSTRSTRETAGALTIILQHLAEPTSPKHLARIYRVWRREDRGKQPGEERLESVSKLLETCRRVEEFTAPQPGRDWLETLADRDEKSLLEHLPAFRDVVQRWQRAVVLPIDQLILTIAADIFSNPEDLALAQRMAVVLRRSQDINPEWRLPELLSELESVARNERRFLGLSQEELGFDPEQYKGLVVVSTVHKAKGLEWDRVYLMSVNSYDYPSAEPDDSYRAEKWFIRRGVNLEAEALASLKRLASDDQPISTLEFDAAQQARLDNASERLRLLYVGITRARKELIVTWNNGRRGDQRQSLPFKMLQAYWEGIRDGITE
jgi:DNA helicase-2/ATP-dependent DNA helicase PcrA